MKVTMYKDGGGLLYFPFGTLLVHGTGAPKEKIAPGLRSVASCEKQGAN